MARIKKVSDLAAFQAKVNGRDAELARINAERADKLRLEKERKIAEAKAAAAKKEEKERERRQALRKKEDERNKVAYEAMRLAVGTEAENAGLFGTAMPSTSALRGGMIFIQQAFEKSDAKTIRMFEELDRKAVEAAERARAERAARRAVAGDDRQDLGAEGEGVEPAPASEEVREGGEAA